MIKNELGRLEMHPLPPVKKAKLVIIGEYPNITELRAGQYFISRGADALERTLTKFGISDDDCYYTVAVPYLMSKKNKVIPVSRYQQERERLIREIKESGAKVVMPLGTMATSLLSGVKSMTITKVLGNVIDIPELPDVKIIPNYHPALLLHSPGNYKVFQNVIDTVAQYYNGRVRDPGVTNWTWVDTPEALIELTEKINKLDYIGADIETSSLNTKQATIWNLGICVSKNECYVVTHELFVSDRELIKKLFQTKCTWVWHGGKYDTSVLYWNNFREARLDEDTMLLHYCMNETSGTHGLGICATVYLGADEYKSKMNSEFSAITDMEAYLRMKTDLAERVAVDADYTYQLYENFKPQVANHPDWSKLYNKILMPGANFLREVEMRGLKVDVPYLESRVPHYEKQIADVLAMIEEAAAPYWDKEMYKAQTGAKTAGDVFKPTSVKQLAWMVYDRLKLKPTDRGARKRGTGADVLESIPNPPEFILKILELRKVKKEYSTYVTSYLKCRDEQHIVHPTFNLHVTATGRLSCTDPNVQNVPSSKPDVRDAFIPRGKNRILMEVDYSGAELRVLAYMSGDEALRKALVEGDLHSEVAEGIFGPDFTKLQRGIAKTINFGIAYGRGAGDLSATFEVSKEEAQSWIDGWAAKYPKAWAYLQSCETAVRNGETLVTLYGRHRRLGLIHQGNFNDLSNEAKNFRIQSVSSDNTLLAAMKANKELEEKYDALIINLIHDSVLIDLPADPATVQAVATLMAETMINLPIEEYNCDVPFSSDVDIGVRWGSFVPYDREQGTVECELQGETVHEEYGTWIGAQVV